MLGYAIEQRHGRFWLTHGQTSEGYNNAVPVETLNEAWEIAREWRSSGVRLPWPDARGEALDHATDPNA